jgi:hypothetical protein
MKIEEIKSSDFTIKQLISLIANIRGSLYCIQNDLKDKCFEQAAKEVELALVMTSFELVPEDTEKFGFSPLPKRVIDNCSICVGEQEKKSKKSKKRATK